MKKALKIFGITLSSMIGIVLLVIGLAIWVVFTPERLTPIVRNVAKEYVKCEHHIGKVELTFFSTFPHFGLALDSITLVNPTTGANSDTVAHIPHAVVSVDVMAFLNEKTLSIPTINLPDMQANIYVAADGTANYDVLSFPTDTTAEDTTAFTLPFKQLMVGELALSAKSLHYKSEPDTTDIALHHTAIQTAIDMVGMRVALHNAQLATNSLELALDGWAEVGDTLQTNMRLTFNNWQVDSLIPLLPFTLPTDIAQLVQGSSVSLDATAAINMEDGNADNPTSTRRSKRPTEPTVDEPIC